VVKYWHRRTVYKTKFFGYLEIFSLCVYEEYTYRAKNEEKLIIPQLIIVHHVKILDPFFLYQMGWIKPKNHFTLLSF